MSGAPDRIQSFFYVEGIVVHMADTRVACRVKRPHPLVLADIVAECIVDGIHAAEHHRPARIPVAVVILIQRSVAIVRIPCLSVSVPVEGIQRIKALIVLEHRVFTLPRPDCRCNLSKCCPTRHSRSIINTIFDLRSSIFRNIVLDNRSVTVHRCNGVSARFFNIIVLDHYIRSAVFSDQIIRDSRCPEFPVISRISRRYPPPVYPLKAAVFDHQVVIFRDSRCLLIRRFLDYKVDSSVCHMLVLDISSHVMDVQIVQHNMLQSPFILGDSRHTGPVHHAVIVIRKPFIGLVNALRPVIRDLKPAHLDIFYVFQQYGT